MSIIAQFNPSTLKLQYNAVTGKVLVVDTCFPAGGSFDVDFSGVLECDCGACNWPSDLNSLDVNLPYIRDNVCRGTNMRFWENTIDGWFISVHCYLEGVFKNMMCSAAYFEDDNCGTHNRGMAFLSFHQICPTHPNILSVGQCCVNTIGHDLSDCSVPGVLTMGYDGTATLIYKP